LRRKRLKFAANISDELLNAKTVKALREHMQIY